MTQGPSHAALRLAVVGPSHPHKGGVAAHTTTLAHELVDAGHEVTLVSWSHLYPSALYPGEQAVPGGAPDVEPFPRTLRVLSWARPDTWVRAGRRLRDLDAIIVVHVIPPVVPAHLALLRAAGAGPRGSGRDGGPVAIAITHNVLPHEPRPGDRGLMRRFLSRVDSVVVHSAEQAVLARDLGAHHVRELDLPPHLPGGPRVDHVPSPGPTRLLALGIVRDYKGVDLLLEAVREVPEVRVTVAGEMWGEAGRRVRELAHEQGLAGRVEVHGGYVPADRIAELMAHHDVLTLTYRDATASQNVLLARRHGLPVLATDVGTFGEQVLHGVDGLLVPPGDHEGLVAALRQLADPSYADRLRASVRPPDEAGPWAEYVGAIEAMASDDADALVTEVRERRDPGSAGGHGSPGAAGSTGQGLRSGAAEAIRSAAAGIGRGVRAVRRERSTTVALRATDFPDWIRATDVLALDVEALDAREWARDAGLPRSADAVAAWAALGAIAAIVRIGDSGRRTARILDESGSRSPLSRWARALGFQPVQLELSGQRSSVEVLDLDTASLDVIVRVHPVGCSAADVDLALGQASWALRSGGLLVLTVPIGDDDPDWALRPADVRGLLARASDRGFVLVGDLDGDLQERMRAASRRAADGPGDGTAYGILRLTFRRR